MERARNMSLAGSSAEAFAILVRHSLLLFKVDRCPVTLWVLRLLPLGVGSLPSLATRQGQSPLRASDATRRGPTARCTWSKATSTPPVPTPGAAPRVATAALLLRAGDATTREACRVAPRGSTTDVSRGVCMGTRRTRLSECGRGTASSSLACTDRS